MTEITASLVKELRERSGAGMMDCKRALNETKGDIEAAIDWLRTKGLSAAAKKASRTAAEGLVALITQENQGALVEINAETDFVGRNEIFQNFIKEVAQIILKKGDDLSQLTSTIYPQTGRHVSQELTDLISVIGENMNIRRAKKVRVEQGVIAGYIHNAVQSNLGRVGVLIALESKGDPIKLEILGKQIAMHVAAAMPQACSINELDAEVVERERKIYIEQARASGKKDEFIEKMVEGRLRKFYEESVLLEQIYLIDDTKRRVFDVINDFAKELGSSITLKEFALFKVGEGIEKDVKDFAAEVAEQLAQK